mmetsp:Transcript_14828/g.58167  ORF Transcript_14828/g.58167 Transcript_14828/m.58167 type:complete len:474 (+) Transcript_14828:1114-2535(+)
MVEVGVAHVLRDAREDLVQLRQQRLRVGQHRRPAHRDDPHHRAHDVFVVVDDLEEDAKESLEVGSNVVARDAAVAAVVAGEEHLLERIHCVGANHLLLRLDHVHARPKHLQVHLLRLQLVAEGGDELKCVSLDDGMVVGVGSELGQDGVGEEVHDGNEGVGLSGAEVGVSSRGREGDDEVDGHVLLAPVGLRVGGVLLEEVGDVATKVGRHCLVIVLAQAPHQVAGAAPPRQRVVALDVAPDVLVRVLLEVHLVVLGEDAVGDDDLFTDPLQRVRVGDHCVEDACADDVQVVQAVANQRVETRAGVLLSQDVPDVLDEHSREGLDLDLVLLREQRNVLADVALHLVNESRASVVVIAVEELVLVPVGEELVELGSPLVEVVLEERRDVDVSEAVEDLEDHSKRLEDLLQCLRVRRVLVHQLAARLAELEQRGLDDGKDVGELANNFRTVVGLPEAHEDGAGGLQGGVHLLEVL